MTLPRRLTRHHRSAIGRRGPWSGHTLATGYITAAATLLTALAALITSLSKKPARLSIPSAVDPPEGEAGQVQGAKVEPPTVGTTLAPWAWSATACLGRRRAGWTVWHPPTARRTRAEPSPSQSRSAPAGGMSWPGNARGRRLPRVRRPGPAFRPPRRRQGGRPLPGRSWRAAQRRLDP